MDEIILEAKNIVKTFSGVKALNNGEIRAFRSKVNILMGENGAGKSTILNIISGMFAPDSGSVYFEGNRIEDFSINKFKKLGITIVHQELKLVDDLSIAENILLTREPLTIFKTIDYKKMYAITKEILKSIDMDLNPKTLVKDLSIAQKQMIEIAKGISQKSKVLILDEPTSSIGPEESEQLFKIIHKLKESGVAILYITHRMNELEKIGDYITVFRDGNFVSESKIEDTSEDKIIEQMVGRKLEQQFPLKFKNDELFTLMKVNNLGNKFVSNISFEIKANEILVISGLVGSGRSELAKTIAGYYSFDYGSIEYKNKNIYFNHPKNAIDNGVYYLSENRKEEGLHLEKSIAFNLTLASLKSFSNKYTSLINLAKEKIENKSITDKLKVRMSSTLNNVDSLSGGNQQKIAIGKALLTKPEIIFFDEPTRGVDVGARKEIYKLMHELKKSGKAVVVISSDLPEVIGLYDRLIVMREGKIMHDTYDKLDQNEIMKYAFGVSNKFI
ncbi:hypothetical protein CJJ23_03345 [Mycoplasmopsis agassizii]|uniref:ABC transporter domain-containing protein n=1 Tax=Mycoplasmopsis agassizii TaxID=33922 RepID=A0A269TJS3_9BACT|nr:sugar ABC transporter ATP-binding protein [Mycoplasmopsis agassizii]PAK21148.1 hypothetical protein CJJ23_03345 [Mycoplasmopsis agassizii]